MTLTQLRYFQMVARYQGVTRAAEQLHISQPSVSNAIRELEKEFGVQLLARQNRSFALTREGLEFLEYAESLLRETDRTIRQMKDLGAGEKMLRLGVPPMIGSLVLPVLYREYFPLHPRLVPQITEDGNRVLLQMLGDNRLDMAFLPHEQEFPPSFSSQPLIRQRNMYCVSRNHPFADKESISIGEMGEQPLVLFKNSFLQTERILERFSRQNIEPRVLLSTTQLSTMQNMIKSGIAAGVMFEFLLKESPELVGIPLSPPMETKISLVWKTSNYMTEEMRGLVKFVEEFQTVFRRGGCHCIFG